MRCEQVGLHTSLLHAAFNLLAGIEMAGILVAGLRVKVVGSYGRKDR